MDSITRDGTVPRSALSVYAWKKNTTTGNPLSAAAQWAELHFRKSRKTRPCGPPLK